MGNIKFIKKILLILFLFSLISFYLHYEFSQYEARGPFYVVSLSSNGRYVVTSGEKNKLILWDLITHQKKIISRHANIYSAYFVKHSNNFMWQDLNNKVYIKDIKGKLIKSFQLNYPTYGEVITAGLTSYFSSDSDWRIFEGDTSSQTVIKETDHTNTFMGCEKLLNLTLSDDNQLLLTAGTGNGREETSLSGVVAWRINTKQPFQQFFGNIEQTYAAISPDTHYVVGGDVQPLLYIWNTKTGKKIQKPVLYGGAKPPKKIDEYPPNNYAVFALKFIDESGHYLRFITGTPYAVLYSIHYPYPLKYFFLGNHPLPSSGLGYNYARNESLDTSPTAHVLVIASKKGGEILVYHFDPKTLSLSSPQLIQ